MEENLVIVESPAKAKTIEKFLGKGYHVKSSFGHICDLPKKGMGIDLDNNFEPVYEISPDKAALVSELTKLSRSAKTVWLASDEDREGEAISWHLYQTLGLDGGRTRRIVFHEITKNAILNAIEHPRDINMDLVNAQQARRVLDRLVGFELSPVLWKKVKPSLSAGRVQSVAVRLIVEREKEIQNFTPNEYFRVTADFVNQAAAKFTAELNKRLGNAASARELLERCNGASFTVREIEKKPSKRHPAPPFTTSTLQQEASRKLGMSVSQTMSVAQKLYEAGLITYMRTDSVHLSNEAVAAISKEVKDNFGENYFSPRDYKTTSKGAQEAHEAIRPSYIDRQSAGGTIHEKRLYELIWKRTVASQMAVALIDRTVVNIDIDGYREYYFTATGEVIVFDGFLRLYSESTDEESQEGGESMLPSMTVGEKLREEKITATQRFTTPPARYSEASLVKRLEELGIGRPSTYAPTISTVINRGYVIKESREGSRREYLSLTLDGNSIKEMTLSENHGWEKHKLFPTDIGIVVTDYLEQQFPAILDYNFTANVEKEFDEIAHGSLDWHRMIRQFYDHFHPTVETALNASHTNTTRLIGNDPATGRPVYAKIGRFGPYVQLGENEEIAGSKPQYSNLGAGHLISTITLEEALTLFKLPRNLGEYEGKEMVVGSGRFGPYVRHDGKFTSLGKTDSPYDITPQRAIELIEEKRKKERERVIKTFDQEPDIQLLNGRWGPYIAYKGNNYKIPKSTDPASLSYDEVMKLVESQQTGDGSSRNSKTNANNKGGAKPKRKAPAKSKTKKQMP